MYFVHSDAIWDVHPDLHALVMVLDHVRGKTSDHEREQALLPSVERRLAASSTESKMPEIAAWRTAFSKMGLTPSEFRCAAEALLRRYRRQKSLPSFHPVVDYLNVASMAFAIPIAAFDCAKIVHGITVRPADGSERYASFQGEIEHPLPEEVVFADEEGNAHSRRWTFRQSAASLVSADTDRALIVAEALHAQARRDLDALAHECESGLGAMDVRVHRSMKIEPDQRRFEF